VALEDREQVAKVCLGTEVLDHHGVGRDPFLFANPRSRCGRRLR
jgi:hypothetical protein